MTTFITLYALVGLIACFSALVITRVYDWRDEMGLIMYSGVMFVLWPIAVPVTLIAFLVLSMDSLASKAANRITSRKR